MKTTAREMSVGNSLLMKSGEATGLGMREFETGLASAKNNYREKVNLKRAKNITSGKISPSSHEVGLKTMGSLESRKTEKTKLRNAKVLENCLTARSHFPSPIRVPKKGSPEPGARTRSMSPTPSNPSLNVEWPLRKFYSYMTKIAEQFEIVKIFIKHKPEEGDSLQEVNRQRKRATEFSVRFSRNNLYQMKRFVSDIKQITVPYLFDNVAKTDNEILCKKILLAYQSATQSLQTYINYIKSGQNLDVPEKIRELIVLILDLHLCCDRISLPNEQIDILSACKELIVLLDMKIAEEMRKTPVLRQSDKLKETQKEDKRFSMYKTKLTPSSNWKKKTEALAKIKFGVPKLSYLKRMKKKEDSVSVPRSTFAIYSQRMHDTCHRKASKTEIYDEAKRVIPEKPTRKTHATPREVTSQDDDIETVVQSIDNDDCWAPNRVLLEDSDFSPDNPHNPGRDDASKNCVQNLVMQTIHKIQNPEKNDVENSLKALLKSLTCQPNPRENFPSRNVKLIHVISTDPIPEEPEEELREEEATKLESTTAEPTTWEGRPRNLFRPISGKIDVAAKGRTMKVSEETCSVAVTYRKILSEYRRNNIMYKKGMPIRPYELVPRISDEIINNILLEISSGMENENLLTQLYYNELLESL